MNGSRSFIEVQFPVSKVSKESYKERKANLGQTLTGLGKWWGRKPLIMVRATILGLLMPASSDPQKDREIFLKILTMDEEGLWHRKKRSIPAKKIYQYLTSSERDNYFAKSDRKITFKKNVNRKDKLDLQKNVFNRLSYDEKLRYCVRPEEAENLPREEWQIINAYLGTEASNLQELIQELGERKFSEVPTVGDCFCGGGSVPFEAARIGCNVYASELNPVAMLLTWASLNINGAPDNKIKELREFQQKVFDLADKQIMKWGIEHNEVGDRANSYLYCHETVCPVEGCGYKVPLAPSWVIGKGTKTVAILEENDNKGFDIEIISNATEEQIQFAEQLVTIRGNNLVCPHCKNSSSIAAIRKDRTSADGSMEYGLRKWAKSEFIPLEDDVFQERLYCIRYEKEFDEEGRTRGERYYQAPTKEDLEREKKVVDLLQKRFANWQAKGYIPDSAIEDGEKTFEPIRTRGWAYWHQLFNPRQLLLNGLLMELVNQHAVEKEKKAIGLLSLNRCFNFNSKLSRWVPSFGVEKVVDTYSNQALNTIYDFGSRSLVDLKNIWFFNINNYRIQSDYLIKAKDARAINSICHIWVTDPPYADAINYHELSEFFLAWDRKMLLSIFPDWYADSKRVLAVKGTGPGFKQSMVQIYKNLSDHMPDHGMQIVMFTHQDVSVWEDLTLILWSAGLRVTAAWNIATETDAIGLKHGNYIKGTVLLVLRKQTSTDTPYMDELYIETEQEVKRQIDSMQELEDKEDPNFSDADYLLAAYAASLKVLTTYQKFKEIDVQYELSKERTAGKETPIEGIINAAVKIAYDYLIPDGFDRFTWKMLIPEERFYIKALDLEKNRVSQIGAFQELARGFGVKEYRNLLASTRANRARLKTAMEFEMSGMGDSNSFSSSLLRNVLAALHQSIKTGNTVDGKYWLRNEVPNYWDQRNVIIELLDFIATLLYLENMSHWEDEARYARLLRELVKNDGV